MQIWRFNLNENCPLKIFGLFVQLHINSFQLLLIYWIIFLTFENTFSGKWIWITIVTTTHLNLRLKLSTIIINAGHLRTGQTAVTYSLNECKSVAPRNDKSFVNKDTVMRNSQRLSRWAVSFMRSEFIRSLLFYGTFKTIVTTFHFQSRAKVLRSKCTKPTPSYTLPC